MEKQSFVRKGELRLPVGFRFHPTDEELVVHYLKRKALNLPLPASVIPEFDVRRVEPWDLPGDQNERRYFFSNRKWNGNKCNRVSGGGYWRSAGKGIKIVSSGSNQIVGLKKSMAFYGGKGRRATRTPWAMHEYRLVGSDMNPNSAQDWVVHCIFQREKRSSNRRVISRPNSSSYKTGNMKASGACEIDSGVVEHRSGLSPPPPSSCSSGITEASSNGADQEETSAFVSLSTHSSMREH